MSLRLKNNLIKIISGIFVFCILGWGVSIVAVDDISSAHNNFSVVGIVSSIDSENLSLDQAQGSDKSNRTNYNLNIIHVGKIETNKYQALTINDIKVGDKIIAQGLTNGSSFFIKRIISFADVTIKPEESKKDDVVEQATTTDTLSTSSESVMLSGGNGDNSTTTTESGISTDAINDATSTSTPISASTDSYLDISSSTVSSTTEDVSTTTDSIVDKVVDVVQEVIETVKETIVDIINNNDQSSTTIEVTE